jgi:hypothetical protein
LNSTTASLAGTLNLKLVNGFVPTLGTTLKILDFSSETGQFTTVNGSAINSSEHFAITYQATDVLLTVVSGAAPADAGLVPGSSLGAEELAERVDLRPTPAHFDPAFRSALPAVSIRTPWRMNHAGFAGRTSLFSHGRSGRARGILQFSLLNPLSMPAFSFTSD